MAADGGGKAPSLIEELFSAGRRFDFFQAVALLEIAGQATSSVGASGDPSAEALTFAGNVRLASPTAPIESVERPRAGRKARMTVNFMAVAGALGPLPLPFSELVLRRAQGGDTAARDFLDVFNHRLLSIAYRIKKRHRVGLGTRAPEQDDAYRYLASLAGLGTPHLAGRLGPVSDGAVVAHAGLFSREARSMAGLTALLGAHFGVPVEGVPLTGAHHPIEPPDLTRLGPSGQNRLLGRSAVLGQRTWDQESTFDIRVGPLDVEDYLRFLPGGDRLAPFCALTRFYAGPALEFRVEVLLDPERARPRGRRRALPARRPMTLGERPRLGTTAWCGSPWGRRAVVFRGAER